MIRPLALCALLALSACMSDETISAFVPADTTWRLTRMGDAAVSTRATITFPEPGRVAGQAPCNRWFAAQSVPYPWIDIGPIGATRMACPDLADETAFFTALEAATLVEVSGDTLILSDDTGPLLEFTRTD